MLFKNAVLDEIRKGRIDLAFRRWTRPTVRAGGSLRTPVGILAIDAIDIVHPNAIPAEDVRRAGFKTLQALLTDLRSRRDGTVYRIAFHLSEPDARVALRDRAIIDPVELADLQDRLAYLDRTSRIGAWTTRVLSLIGSRDGITAGEIAGEMGIEKFSLKRRVRLLKDLGLTESLPSGYRLSTRGRTAMTKLWTEH